MVTLREHLSPLFLTRPHTLGRPTGSSQFARRRDINAVAREPKLAAHLASEGIQVIGSGPDEFGPFLKHGPCDSIRGVSKMLNLLVSRFKSLQRFAYPTPVNLPIPSLA